MNATNLFTKIEGMKNIEKMEISVKNFEGMCSDFDYNNFLKLKELSITIWMLKISLVQVLKLLENFQLPLVTVYLPAKCELTIPIVIAGKGNEAEI